MPAILSVDNLRYAPPADAGKTGAGGPAFPDFQFEVDAGEAVALAGPRGSGKSTVIRILTGLIREYAGSVHFHGKELKDWGREFYERIGVSLAPSMAHGSLTVRENLEMAGGLYGGDLEPVPGLLERMGLSRDAATRANRLRPSGLLRLSLARAVLHRPEALFLDVSRVDSGSASGSGEAALIRSLVESQKRRGGLTVLTAEDPAQAGTYCDRIIPMPMPMRRSRPG